VEHAHPVPAPFPWRAATVVAGAVALVELVALIAIGLMHFAPKSVNNATATVQHHAAAPARTHVHAVQPKPVPAVPLRPVAKTRVLVLNGNGVAGAAGAEAAHLHADGYPVSGAVDADRHDYSTSMVFFVPGWQKEARRLAHSVGIRVVAPVDGLRPAQLKGSKVVLLLGR
jgi:hypothetical protein